MSDAVKKLQAAVVTVLEAHPALSNILTGIFDGPPPRAAYPYILISDGTVSDWSSKTEQGRDVRLSITIWDDGEEPARLHDLMGHVEDALDALPADLPGWQIASNNFLRSLVARDAAGPWAGLIEQRIRLLSK